MNLQDLAGVWRSSYIYESITRGAHYASEHYLRAQVDGDELVFESIKGEAQEKSYMILRLKFETNVFMAHVASGNWQEVTQKDGYYEGQVYGGTVQLVYDADKKTLEGKYTDYKKQGFIGCGEWTMQYLGPKVDGELPPLNNDTPVEAPAHHIAKSDYSRT